MEDDCQKAQTSECCKNEFYGEQPDTLYHYTGKEGVQGILKDRRMWGTNINFLNDKREYVEAVDRVQEKVKGKANSPDSVTILEYIRLWEHVTYVVSFSSKKDDLSQWRSYCSEAEAFCIGFKFEALRRISEQQNWELRKCLYQREDQERELNRVIDAGGYNHNLVAKYAPFCKHEAFCAEKEWRLARPLQGDGGMVKFRPGSSGIIIPYIQLCLEDHEGQLPFDSIIDSVWVGPVAHAEEWVLYLRLYLLTLGLQPSIVMRSDIPYRPKL